MVFVVAVLLTSAEASASLFESLEADTVADALNREVLRDGKGNKLIEGDVLARENRRPCP